MQVPSSSKWVDEFVARTEELLGPLWQRSGHVMYSAASTLRPGPLYLLGVNPGGDAVRQTEQTIAASLAEFPTQQYNHYLDGRWRERDAGAAPLQRRLATLCAAIGVELRDVCAGNLIFVRTRSAAEIEASWADECWPVHELVIERVQPRVLLTLGTGRWPFGYLRRRFAPDAEPDRRPSGHGKCCCKRFDAPILGRTRTVVGLPHLSRFNVTHPETLRWLQTLVSGN